MAEPSTLPRSSQDAPSATREPVLFLALRADALTAPGSRHALARLDEVILGRAESTRVRRGAGRLELRMPDARISSQHAVVKRVLHRWVVEDLGSRNGTFVNGRRVTRASLCDADVIEVGHTFFIYHEHEAAGGADDTTSGDGTVGLRTQSTALARDFARLELVAASGEPVLVLGESGTGKELVARAVHARSRRRGELVAVNCGALPEAMVEAELFGHRRGAFSGAVAHRTGLVRSADGGTLFLDEIGDLRLASQAALLRALQEHEVLPVGAERPVAVDLRVVSATHRDLDELVTSGGFRADLLARLRGFLLRLPPLRQRREDLGLIVADLLRARLGASAASTTMTSAAARALLLHDWPHNIRELDRALGTALSLAQGGPLRPEHLPEAVAAAASPRTQDGAGDAIAEERVASGPAESPPGPPAAEVDVSPLRDARRAELIRLLTEQEGNVAAVARILGKGRTQVLRWLERYGIDPGRFRP